MDEIEAHFFPAQTLTLALVCGLRRRLHHRHHRAIQLADEDHPRRRPGGDHPRDLLGVDPFGMLFGGPLNRAHRHRNAVMFLQLGRHLPKRMIGPKIGHHPLQRQRTAPALTPATALNGRSMPVPFRQSGSITSIAPKVVYQ